MFLAFIFSSLGFKRDTALLDVVERSGYLADLDTNDVSMLMFRKSDLMKVAAFPFRTGEATNRLMAFTIARREAIRLHKAGKLKDINGRPFKGTIDDDIFLRIVTDKAKVTALNMGKAGELEAFTGYGSTIFQFMQVLPKTLGIFTTKQLDTVEKLGIGATLVGLYGAGGIPFSKD